MDIISLPGGRYSIESRGPGERLAGIQPSRHDDDANYHSRIEQTLHVRSIAAIVLVCVQFPLLLVKVDSIQTKANPESLLPALASEVRDREHDV